VSNREIHFSFMAHRPLEFILANARACKVSSEFDFSKQRINGKSVRYKTKSNGIVSGTIRCTSPLSHY
jgi:hypothetical protein